MGHGRNTDWGFRCQDLSEPRTLNPDLFYDPPNFSRSFSVSSTVAGHAWSITVLSRFVHCHQPRKRLARRRVERLLPDGRQPRCIRTAGKE